MVAYLMDLELKDHLRMKNNMKYHLNWMTGCCHLLLSSLLDLLAEDSPYSVLFCQSYFVFVQMLLSGNG